MKLKYLTAALLVGLLLAPGGRPGEGYEDRRRGRGVGRASSGKGANRCASCRPW